MSVNFFPLYPFIILMNIPEHFSFLVKCSLTKKKKETFQPKAHRA